MCPELRQLLGKAPEPGTADRLGRRSRLEGGPVPLNGFIRLPNLEVHGRDLVELPRLARVGASVRLGDRLDEEVVLGEGFGQRLEHEEWTNPARDACVSCRTVIEDGRPASVITKVADEVDADVIVVGRRGRGGVAELPIWPEIRRRGGRNEVYPSRLPTAAILGGGA